MPLSLRPANIDVIMIDHMRHMKDRAIICNTDHFDSEIQIEALRNYPWEEVKPQAGEVFFPDGKRLIVLAKGRLVNLGCATGHLQTRALPLLTPPWCHRPPRSEYNLDYVMVR